MAVALGGNYVDTGVKRDITVSCTVQLDKLPNTAGTGTLPSGQPPPTHLLPNNTPSEDVPWVTAEVDTTGQTGDPNFDMRLAGNHWSHPTGPGDPTPDYQRVVFLTAGWLPDDGSGNLHWRLLEAVDHVPQGSGSNTYTFTAVMTGIRLGVVDFRLATGADAPVPEFWTNHELRYGWFLDRESTLTISAAGYSSPTLWWQGTTGSWNTTQDPLTTRVPSGLGTIGQIFVRARGTFEGGSSPSNVQVKFRSIQSDGTMMDTADIYDSGVNYVTPVGAGGLDFWPPNRARPVAQGMMAAPFHFTYDLDISKFGDGTLNAQVTDNYLTPVQLFHPRTGPDEQKTPQSDSIALPALSSHLVQITGHPRRNKSFAGAHFFHLYGPWANAQIPLVDSEDRQVPIYGSIARHDPATVEIYQPVKVAIHSVNVHRPNSLTPSSWVSSDTGKLTVAEGANSVFTVSATGATATRTLLTHWRNWINYGDPLFAWGKYEITRHDQFGTGDDVFGWQHHGWLQVVVSAPAAGTLTLTVTGVQLEINDSHVTNDAQRHDDYEHTEHPFEVTYDLALASGANTVWVDLLFPTGGSIVPFYYGRVDSLRLSGFAVGTYTLSGMTLVPRENIYLKCAFGAPVQRRDYDAIVFAADGSFGLGNWPDQLYKTEQGQYGGGVRSVFILTGYPSGIVQDHMLSLEEFWETLAVLEGFTAVYDSTVFDTANRDPYGVALSPETAEWTRSIVPFVRVAPGADYEPECGPRIRNLAIVNGHSFKVLVRWELWGGIEVLVASGGARAGAGETVTAVRIGGGLGPFTATTDVSGYAVITPVPGDSDYDVTAA